MLTPRGKALPEAQRRVEPVTLYHVGQQAQHATNWAIPAPPAHRSLRPPNYWGNVLSKTYCIGSLKQGGVREGWEVETGVKENKAARSSWAGGWGGGKGGREVWLWPWRELWATLQLCEQMKDTVKVATPGAGIMEANDHQVTTVFTVQPSFHYWHSTNRVSWSDTIVGEWRGEVWLHIRRLW